MSDADDTTEIMVVPEVFDPAPAGPLKLLDVGCGDENLRPPRYGENIRPRRKAVLDKSIEMPFKTMIAAMDNQRVSLAVAPGNRRDELAAGKKSGLTKGAFLFSVSLFLTVAKKTRENALKLLWSGHQIG
jgi:hypothetical protein